MKNFAFATLVSLLLSAVALAAFEGVYSLNQWRKPHRSVVYQLAAMAGLVKPRGDEGAYASYFSDPQELANLMPIIEEQGIGVGSTPFPIHNPDAYITTKENGCPTLKPNLRMKTFFLHTSAFGPYGFPGPFYSIDKKLDPRLQEFFRRYGGPSASMSTNSLGERLTIPDVAADRVVLIVGDSVAFGTRIDDDKTIASQMQARDHMRRYINLGVPGNTAAESHCRIEAATQRYKGKIDELIYVYCENDFDEKIPYGTPKEVVESLQQIARRENISKVTVVFAPMIYMVLPEVTRDEGSIWYPTLKGEKQRAQLKGLVEAAGLRWVDSGALARSEEQETKSSLAIFAYYNDATHLSSYGTWKLVDHLMGPG
jgi:hypothetical protein